MCPNLYSVGVCLRGGGGNIITPPHRKFIPAGTATPALFFIGARSRELRFMLYIKCSIFCLLTLVFFMPHDRSNFRGKYFIVTYPQCNLDHQTIWNQCLSKGASGAVICSELHASGDPHRHAFVCFRTRKELSVRSLDVNGYHPNIQACRSPEASLAYVKEDGVWTEFGDTAITEPGSMGHPTQFRTESEWLLDCYARNVPYGYAKRLWDLSQTYDTFTIGEGAVSDDDFEHRVDGRLAVFQYDFSSGCSLILEGPSGCGKTTWAKYFSPKPSLFVTHLDVLRQFRPGFHQSIIFDDMQFSHLPRETQIHLLDTENPRAIHVRYGTATIPAGVVKIFTCNQPIFLDDPAIRRRRHRFFIQ